MNERKSWYWILEDGTAFTADDVEHKFDELIRRMIKYKVINAVKHEISERKKFPIQPDDVFDGIGAVETVFDIEKNEVRLKDYSLFVKRDELADALERLEPREKEYIELSFVRELTPEEIAEMMHVTKEYVYLMRHRILEKLRNMIGDGDGPKGI